MTVLRILLTIFIISILALAGVSYWIYAAMTAPHQHEKAGKIIQIRKGATPNEVIDQLSTENIIAGALAVRVYLRTFGDASKIQAGDYQFNSPITPLQVLKELESGEENVVKLTIPEGFTRFDIAKRLAEKFPQNPPMDDKAILYFMDDVSLVKDFDPLAKNLEGYMYPSTYSFPKETKPQEIIKRLVEQFRKVWKPEWNDRAKQLGKTPREIVTLASLIETESGVESERPIVSSVIYNRLAKNIPLGIDMTFIYVAKMQNRWDGTVNKSDVEVDSPYNTRRYGGIPPGPISSVSESAINAALNPANTNYLYYVRNVQKNDGSHHFYSSAAEFEKGKAEYQRWLEEERKLKRANER